MKPCTFQPKLDKLKKSTPRKFLIFQATNTPQKILKFSRKKAVLIFSQKKAVLISPETETLKNLLHFRK